MIPNMFMFIQYILDTAECGEFFITKRSIVPKPFDTGSCPRRSVCLGLFG
jgi:hypothetical protein